MKHAAIVLDLDGTLLNSNKEVSTRNKEAVLACHRQGISIIYATARPPRAVKELLPPELLAIGSFVFYNGAFIACTTTGEEIHLPIHQHVSNALIDYCAEHHQGIELSFEDRDIWYSLKEIDYAAMIRTRENPITKGLEELRALSPTKILITSMPDSEMFVERFAAQLNIVVTDHGKLIQVMSPEASKEKGVQYLCGTHGIPMDQVIAFGDDYNDHGLFLAAGYSVAMGNAVEKLKEIANEITATHDEDGVGQVLERILTNNQAG